MNFNWYNFGILISRKTAIYIKGELEIRDLDASVLKSWNAWKKVVNTSIHVNIGVMIKFIVCWSWFEVWNIMNILNYIYSM